MSRFLNKNLAELKPYIPGEQPQTRKYIKLNTNENPFPPSPKTIAAALAELEKLNLYSDPECGLFREALAERFGVSKDMVFASNGSDETLAFIFQAFSENGAAFADITYGFLPVYCSLYGVNACIIPLRENFFLDITDYFNIGRTVFIVNPNAPTGLAVKLSDIRRLLECNPDNLLVIDEAYVEFGAESSVSLLSGYDNLLIVGTFSKSYSLAGARLGYAVGGKELISALNRVRYSFNPYNVNRMTIAAGAAAVRDAAYFDFTRGEVIKNREYATGALRKMGFQCTDSAANFIFTEHPDIRGEDLYFRLREAGILVRWFDKERINNYLRISVGTMEDMISLVETISKII